MVSSKDTRAEAKKTSARLRLFCKKFFEDFYAKAEEAGRHPSPLEAALAMGRMLKEVTEGEWPDQPQDRPGIPAEVFDSVISRFPQDGYHEAVEAWYRHTPGLEFQKGKPGRKRNEELAETIWKLQAGGKSNRKIQKALEDAGVVLSLEGVESYLKKRRLPH